MSEDIIAIAPYPDTGLELRAEERAVFDPNINLTELPGDMSVWVHIIAPDSIVEQAEISNKVKETFGAFVGGSDAGHGVVLFTNSTTEMVYPDFKYALGNERVYKCRVNPGFFLTPSFQADYPDVRTVGDAQHFIIDLLAQIAEEAGVPFSEFLPNPNPLHIWEPAESLPA